MYESFDYPFPLSKWSHLPEGAPLSEQYWGHQIPEVIKCLVISHIYKALN